ncbi:MAG: hypothetical protein K5922_01905, partial [Clostridiales bacterium]|nr:hypothetical protein [Clostridiales bacterium]
CLTGREAAGDLLLFEARARETVHSDGTCGTCLAGGLRVRAEGKVTAGPDFLRAEGTEIRLRLTMETDYSMEENSCRIPGGMDALREKVRDTLEREWDGPHGAAHTMAAHRMKEGPAPRPGLTPRVELEGEPQINRQVLFGHGLLRAAVTPDSPLPPALQGVWNDEEACQLGWSNDYHLDVNTQMNLWCAETLGEGERLAPLFRFLLQRLIPEGRKTAAGYYGLPGAVTELSTNCFGYAAPYWGRPLAPCPACGFWLCEIVIRHALNHPEDMGFLNQTAIPVLRPFTQFALAYVISDGKGHLAGGPAVSPENGFRAEDRTVYASMGTTFENEQLRILLNGYVRISRMTGASDELAERAAATLSSLPPLRIDSRGGIGEYAHDLPSAVPHHRHLSHLSGLYPGRSITPEDTELAEAAERTIRARILPEEAFESTPWARVMLGLYEARLGHGEQALAQLEYMMKHHGSPSLLLMHPAIPGTQNPRPVWEMDGNTGFVEVVLEMLVQGSENRVRLLPALPARWKKGRIRDIQAGPWKLEEMSWDMPDRLEARLRGQPGKKPEICWNGRRIVRTVPECGELILRENDWG